MNATVYTYSSTPVVANSGTTGAINTLIRARLVPVFHSTDACNVT